MKKLMLGLPLVMALVHPAFAQDEIEVDDVTMEVVKEAREHRSQGVRMRSIVAEYMLAQGDITQEQLDALKAERQAVREELKALKESGDEEALAARIAELREAREANKAELKEYVANHEDLAELIAERREEVRERREQRRDRRRERREGNE